MMFIKQTYGVSTVYLRSKFLNVSNAIIIDIDRNRTWKHVQNYPVDDDLILCLKKFVEEQTR
jgi:hypothetical protein